MTAKIFRKISLLNKGFIPDTNSKGFTFVRKSSPERQRGFTLIEILVSISILLIIMAVTIFSLTTLSKKVEIDSTSQNILSTLRLAQSKTLASENETKYGVHFETAKYVLFSGPTYSSSATDNKVYNLTDSQISTISLNGGGSEVIFDRIRGTTSNYGTVVIRLTTDVAQTKTININSSGQVSISSSITQSNTRIVDSRHLHFDLGYSIQTANTLTLKFYDTTNVTQSIAMAGFFDGPKSVFDWSGTIGVNGSDQVLRIHTHSLTAFATNLSINRDLRSQYNNKALDVLIDNKLIVSYTAAGVATIGAYGGAMTVQ